MLILDKPRAFDGKILKIPLYHRGHLSLFTGAKIWLCLLPGGMGSEVFPELVVSPIHFDSWPDLWRIRITLSERPGLVHELFEVLREHSINILAAESSSMEWQSLHSIEVIVDACRYSGVGGDGSHKDRSAGRIDELNGLRRAILAFMMDDICFDAQERPRISIRRIRNLFEAHKAFEESQRVLRSQGLAPLVKDAKISPSRAAGKAVFVKLPRDIQAGLFEALEQRRRGDYGTYLLVSETTDRFLRAFFMRSSDSILAPTLLHKEEVGALAAITEAIEQAGFNIITSLSRLYEYGTVAQSEFVLQPVGATRKSTDEKILKAKLEDALVTPDLIENYGVRIGYPRGYRSSIRFKQLALPVARGRRRVSAAPRRVHGESVEARLSRLQQAYHQRYRLPSASEQDRMRFTLAASLFAEIEPQENLRKIPLFISYSFKDEERFNRIQKSARGMGFVVTTGKRLGADSTNRDGIRRLMKECTHFLGVWSEDGGIQVGQRPAKDGGGELWWPSPWLHWELGVAESLGLRWRLLISDTIEQVSWLKLVGSTPCDTFSRANFDRRFREALHTLRRMK